MCDWIFYNARVITMDPAQPEAELVAVSGNRIQAVAGNEALDALRSPETRIIDCGGAALLPGFIDAHCHIHAFAEALVSLNLSPRNSIQSISDIQQRIREATCRQPPGTWVRGKGYHEFYLDEKRHPNRWDLDAAAPMHPVKLSHRSGQAHVLNSLALARAGIKPETADPPGGLIDRGLETGLPTGILFGMGEFLAGRIPAVEDAALEQGLGMANTRLLSYGITSIQDATSTNGMKQWNRFRSWKSRNLLNPRVTMMMGCDGFEEWKRNRFGSDANSDLRVGCVKILVNQVTGSLQPCQEELNARILAVDEAGLRAAIHAIEEPEIEAACNAIEYSRRRRGRSDCSHRLEHCSVCPPRLAKRIAALGVTVVTQPSFLYFSGDRYLETVPDSQKPHLYPIGSMLRSGVRAGFGSDFPIADANPLTGIYAAVTRSTEGGNSVLPGEGIPASDALRLYTLDAAAAVFEDSIKGSLTPGKLADLVLLEEDPREIDPNGIKDIRVRLTMLDGRIAWSDDAFIEPRTRGRSAFNPPVRSLQ
jgi:predicted amidohydrolase YtcJ